METRKISSLSNELRSHPDKSLKKHLLNVGRLSKDITSLKNLNTNEFVSHRVLQDISYLIGITHDFGKGTSFFQEYINEKDGSKRNKLKNKTTYHSHISSIFTYYVVKEYLTNKKLSEEKYYKYLPIISFFVVKRHHGNLNNADKETYDFDEEGNETLKKQLGSINLDYMGRIYDEIIPEITIDISTFKNQFSEILQKINRVEKRVIRNIDEENTLFYYFITLFLYSILLDADKTDAANLKPILRKNIPPDIVDNYKQLKFGESKTKINQMRNDIYEEVISNIEDIDLERDKIFSLNVPTGTGKTLTSLSFALKLRKRIEDKKEYTPRIIYSLPFLSIIDQNYDVFNEVLDNPTSDMLLKHHHLSDVSYTTKEDEFENSDKDVGKDLLLIEGWNSEIVVTTFIQFFHSLISNRNKAIRKVHNIVNSIVILDEVQAIPHDYWLLLNKTINFFAKYFNTYFIFLTATQPLIFDEKKGEIKPLVKNKKKYFGALDRVKLSVTLEKIYIEDFEEILKEDIIENPDKDFLIVLNTINSSKQIYKSIKKLDMKPAQVHYLSTGITPKERLRRIREIMGENKERKIIISTQLIEAGVDIDVDVVYRDLGPLDSINQVAGRCNRNFGDSKGCVKIVYLKQNKNGRDYCPSNIYGKFLIYKTMDVFAAFKKNEIEECEFLGLNERYFEEIKKVNPDDDSEDILRNVEELKFSDLSKFRLIDENYPKIDVFVELDEEANAVWQQYQRIKEDDTLNRYERKQELLKIKKQYYDYVISIPMQYKHNITSFDEKSWIGYISQEDIDDCYDLETGFKREDAGGGLMMC